MILNLYISVCLIVGEVIKTSPNCKMCRGLRMVFILILPSVRVSEPILLCEEMTF